jgi:hypothetical protein
MKWPWFPLSRESIMAFVVCLVFGTALLFAYVKAPNLGRSPNAGFGPDWDWTAVPKGEPICIKRPPTSSANKAGPSN